MRDLHHWESYYRGGALVSCPMGREDGYDGEIREVWEAFFRGLPDAARIVDLATGNGALPLIACEVARSDGRRFEVHGVDLAMIDPFRDVPDAAQNLAGVHFHPGVNAEALPFEDASVHGVTSQYGIEYTDAARTMGEIVRVLTRGGQAQFIAHHSQSIVLNKARATLALGAQVFDEFQLFDVTRAYFRAERKDAAEASALHNQLARFAAALRASAAASIESQFADITLAWLARAFELRQGTLQSSIENVDAIELALTAWLQRMRDLVAAAWSIEDVRRVQDDAAQSGLIVGPSNPQMHRGKHLVGWRLQFAKPFSSSRP